MATEESTEPTPKSNQDLATEAASALLAKIKHQALSASLHPESVKHLADAFSTVVGAMPKTDESFGGFA